MKLSFVFHKSLPSQYQYYSAWKSTEVASRFGTSFSPPKILEDSQQYTEK